METTKQGLALLALTNSGAPVTKITQASMLFSISSTATMPEVPSLSLISAIIMRGFVSNSECERFVVRPRRADRLVTEVVEDQLYVSRDNCFVLDNQNLDACAINGATGSD